MSSAYDNHEGQAMLAQDILTVLNNEDLSKTEQLKRIRKLSLKAVVKFKRYEPDWVENG